MEIYSFLIVFDGLFLYEIQKIAFETKKDYKT